MAYLVFEKFLWPWLCECGEEISCTEKKCAKCKGKNMANKAIDKALDEKENPEK